MSSLIHMLSSMTFTALHRVLGLPPGPLTDALLDEAVVAGATETDDLDWKSELPPMKGLPQTDFPKDVAAMANSGGGVIVFGVREVEKAATGRVDVGEFDEAHERSLRSAAITAISPPVFGLNVYRLGTNPRAVVVDVPASIDGPHLIYKNDYFGAPIRNDSDTVWMKERQIEAMYRARFEERRHATETVDKLYSEAATGRNSTQRAWLIAVAHPRVPRFHDRLTREESKAVLAGAEALTLTFADRGNIHPIENVDRHNPRPGLRRWVAVNAAAGERAAWKEAWISIHQDGSVTVAAAIGGSRVRDGYRGGWEVESSAIECAVSDLLALVRKAAEASDNDDYDLRLGIEWTGEQPLIILTVDAGGYTYDGGSIPLHRYTPVEATVNASEPDEDFHRHVHDFAQDCVNQGGVSNLLLIRPPARDESTQQIPAQG